MIKGCIFDMNGVLIDDERFHQASWKELCRRWGKTLTEEEFETSVFGRREKETFAFLLGRDISDDEVGVLSDERTKIVMDLYKEQITLTKGLKEFLRNLQQAQIPIALATSSRRPYMTFILDTFDLWPYFTAIITAEDCLHGKPDPEIYLKAAKALQLAPKLCVAFEDSHSGIASAKAAGMSIIGIATTHTKENLAPFVTKVIDNFISLTIEEL